MERYDGGAPHTDLWSAPIRFTASQFGEAMNWTGRVGAIGFKAQEPKSLDRFSNRKAVYFFAPGAAPLPISGDWLRSKWRQGILPERSRSRGANSPVFVCAQACS